MFPPVPPRPDPPLPAEPLPVQEPLPAELPPLVRPGLSPRARVVRFALVGGGISAVLGGIVLGWLSWLLAEPAYGTRLARGGPFGPFYDRPVLAAQIVSTMLSLAPFLFVVFAIAGAAQAIADGFGRSTARAARLLSETLTDGPPQRRSRRTAESRPAAPGTAAEIVRPLARDHNLEIESEPPAQD